MNAAGIDVSSRKSTVAVLRPFGEVVRLPFDVAHSTEGLASLAEQLKALDGETRVVLEHTGRYYEPVAKALHEAGLYVSAVNPLLIKEYGANSLRRVKTDKADALKIARYALDNWTDLRDYTPMDTIRPLSLSTTKVPFLILVSFPKALFSPLSCRAFASISFLYICLRYSSKIVRRIRTFFPILYTAPAS